MITQLLENLKRESAPSTIILNATFDIGIFNPSTFPDIGTMTFQHQGQTCMILDTHQSVTNMLEATIQLPGTQAPIFDGLPHIRMVNQHGEYEATSLTLPHRMGSGYLAKNAKAMLNGERYDKALKAEIIQNGLHLTMLKYCPMSLLHGVWMSQISGGNYKVAKSVGGKLIAKNVKLAIAKGMVMDHVRPEASSLDMSKFEDGKDRKASEFGIGMIPHDSKRYAADFVTGEFHLNFGQIDSFQIPPCGKDLLKALAVFEVYTFLAKVPMHRSDCHMTLRDLTSNVPVTLNAKPVESLAAAKTAVETAIAECQTANLFAGITTIIVELAESEDDKKKAKAKTRSRKDAETPETTEA